MRGGGLTSWFTDSGTQGILPGDRITLGLSDGEGPRNLQFLSTERGGVLLRVSFFLFKYTKTFYLVLRSLRNTVSPVELKEDVVPRVMMSFVGGHCRSE